MHTKFLALSAAIFLMSSSVTALGNQDIAGNLMQEKLVSDLVGPELALAQGQTGGLRRRKVNDLANGPRYGFPATEKKTTFGRESAEKRSIVGDLIEEPAASAKKTSKQGGSGNDDEDDDSGNNNEAKRELKAIRRRKVKRDIEGALVKVQMGSNALLGESQETVTNAQKSVNKMANQAGRTVDGVALSLKASKSKDSGSGSTSAAVAPPASADKKSSSDDTTKGDNDKPKATTTEPSTELAAHNENNPSADGPSTENMYTGDNMNMNPESMASGSGAQTYNSGSNFDV